MGERAGIWLRVSSTGQDEANQEPDINKWCAERDYEVCATYRLHGKSASKGKHQDELDRVVADMEHGHIKVLVVWQSSRIERRGAYSLFETVHRVREAGGRIEFVQDSHLNEKIGGMEDVMLAMHASVDKMKSDNISKTVKAAHVTLKTNHALNGMPPFGYTSTGPKQHRQLVPDDNTKDLVKPIFERCARGSSASAIILWLNDQGLLTARGKPWHPNSIRKMIRNPTYMGQRCEDIYEEYKNTEGKTKRRVIGYGNVIHYCEPLVGADLWTRANEALNGRSDPRAGKPRQNPKALLSSVLLCMGCGGPMYRHASGPQYARNLYYRCSSPASECCNMPRLDAVDAMVSSLMEQKTEHMMNYKAVAVNGDIADKLATVQRDIRTITSRLSIKEAMAELPGLAAREERLTEEMEKLKGELVIWEESDSGVSYADMWKGKSYEERGAWLRERSHITGRKIFAWAGHKEGDREALVALVGQPGCAIHTLGEMPPLVNEVFLLFDFKLMTENTKETEAAEEVVSIEELDRLAALGRTEWAVGDPALVAA